MEPLVEIHQSKWPELRDLYRNNNWPGDAVAFCLLDTHITYPNLAKFCNLNVYSPDADITIGCVAICFTLGEVMIFPLKSLDKIEKALVYTKIIDWSAVPYVSSASRAVEQCLRRLEKPLRIKIDRAGNSSFTYFLDRDSKPFDVSNSPPETYVAELKPEYLHIVDQTWTYHSAQDMEPLVEIPRKKWRELRDLYRNNWPEDVVAYCFLDTQISYPNLTEFCNVRVYSPEGDMTSGFVAIYFNQDVVYEVMIHPIKSINKIEKALAHTKIIKWTEGLFVSSASLVVEECMRRLEKPIGIKVKTEGNKALKHFLDKSSKQFDIRNNPPDTYVAELKPEHLHIVDQTWTFHSERSYKFFQSLLENHLIYALYSTIDDSPLAWVTISWEGSLTHLYTIEEHRRKGYAEHILKVAVNDQLSKGKDVLGYTLENNLKAQKLFDKLNFERTGFDTWLFIEKE
ncbi:uncharacterized protein LOC123875507 [Maniola jurtina]|uniref:uncharacterized protein LOC123875507 n=1 Tax=Maniola jurtina TaxID=191418 RepID=UPI001E68FA4B|nr:uncharacterized protein LOC123875507 [Maniola jurtina]